MTSRPTYAAIAQHEPFQHVQLADRSIRLFQVQKVPRGREDDPISLTMRQVSTHGQPKYKAISYTWGTAQNAKQILVNGRAFSLHLNLWQLLYHLRLTEETSLLWADALCINQTDLQERNFHVQLMGRIYEQAESVIVWLGPTSLDRTEINAIEFIKETTAFRKAHNDTVFINTYLKREMQRKWEILYAMTDHYYWHRTWIIQEFLFAPTIEVLAAKHKLDWAEFDHLIELLKNEPKSKQHALIQHILQSRTARLTLRRKAGRKSTLHELLQEYSDSACSERRDKVYGILGLAADCAEDLETGEARGVKPDYEKHIVALYLDALECIRLSLPSEEVLPAAALLILTALNITVDDLRGYVSNLLDNSVALSFGTKHLSLCPTYASSVLAVFRWTSVNDLQRQFELYDWGTHVGYEVQKVPSANLAPSPQPRLRRHSSTKMTHVALPKDFKLNAIEVAKMSPDLARIYNYSAGTECHIPPEYIALHPGDKRVYDNPEMLKPPVILEQRTDSEVLRLGFACTNVQRGDLITQFQGLDTTLIMRQIGYTSLLVGNAIMINHSDIIHEAEVDPICDADRRISHCWCRNNVDSISLATDPLSLAAVLTKT